MRIFIIVNRVTHTFESVWTTRALARAAISFHIGEAKDKGFDAKKTDLIIVERIINQLHNKL